MLTKPTSLQIQTGICQQSLVARHLTFCLLELDLVRSRVYLCQQITLADPLPLAIVDLHQLAVDARPNRDREIGRHGTQPLEVHRHVALTGRRDRNSDRRLSSGALRLHMILRVEEPQRDGDHGQYREPQPAAKPASCLGQWRQRGSWGRRRRRPQI
jgi:hypothetical protein